MRHNVPGSHVPIFFGLELTAVTQWSGFPTRAVLASASVKYPLKKHAAPPRPVAPIARNEASIVDACHAYVRAQLKYFETGQDADSVMEFAVRIRSTPARPDGLYWPVTHGEDESPVGPSVASATVGEQESPAAQYGIGRVQTFLINQDGDVYGRDFGPSTAHVAPALRTFRDHRWKKISSRDDENEAFK